MKLKKIGLRGAAHIPDARFDPLIFIVSNLTGSLTLCVSMGHPHPPPPSLYSMSKNRQPLNAALHVPWVCH